MTNVKVLQGFRDKKKVEKHCTKVNNEMTLGRLAPERFSDWLKYVRLFALVVRFVENCKLSCADRKYGELSSDEIDNVETRVLMLEQKDAFAMEYKALSQGKVLRS